MNLKRTVVELCDTGKKIPIPDKRVPGGFLELQTQFTSSTVVSSTHSKSATQVWYFDPRDTPIIFESIKTSSLHL